MRLAKPFPLAAALLISVAALGAICWIAGYPALGAGVVIAGLAFVCGRLLIEMREMRHMNRHLLEAVQAVPAPFAIYDEDERLLTHNEGYRRHHAKALAAVATADGRPTYRDLVAAGAPDDLAGAELDRYVQGVLDAQAPDDGRMIERYYPAIGWLRVGKRRMESGGSVRLAVDVTETRRRQEELAAALDRAKTAEAAQSRFMATMNHELRTPLNGVIGMTKLLQKSIKDEDDLDRLRIVESSAVHLLHLINQVLDYSYLKNAEEVQTVAEDFDVVALIEDVVEPLRMMVATKSVDVVLQFPGDFGRMRRGDPTRVRQVITNLVGNALKFTDDGSVEVLVEESDGDLLSISIADTGMGVPEDRLGSIFDRFSQVSNGETRHRGGTGLGLPITREILHRMGGDISVESVLGRGSTFRATLPLPPAS